MYSHRSYRRSYKRAPPWLYFGLAGAGLLFCAFSFINTAIFMAKSQVTTGHVMDISNYTGTCSTGGKHKRHYPCVKYTAEVVFTTEDQREGTLFISAGSHKTSCSSCQANRRVGEAIEVRYDPNNIADARHNSFFTIWATTFISLMFSGIGVFGGVLSGSFSGLKW